MKQPTNWRASISAPAPFVGSPSWNFANKGALVALTITSFFVDELEPLLMNIHDQAHHIGKVPKRCSSGADQQTQLIRLRREMKDAVAKEKYERASELRDEIHAIEAKSRNSDRVGFWSNSRVVRKLGEQI